MPLDRGQNFLTYGSRLMTAADFRRIALSLDGVEEYSHAGLPAFRIGGRKFASLASQAGGYGNLMLTLEQQAAFVEEAPEIFLPIHDRILTRYHDDGHRPGSRQPNGSRPRDPRAALIRLAPDLAFRLRVQGVRDTREAVCRMLTIRFIHASGSSS